VIEKLGEVAGRRPRYSAQSEAEREAAFQRLTQARLERAYRLASILLRDQSEAEDAVHDAAVRAWQRWDDLRDQAAFDAWFDRIVVSCCRDRARRRFPDSIDLLDLDPAAPDEPGHLAAERDGLRRALAALDPDHRAVVVLRYVEDMSVPAIAIRTGQREGTVKSRLHYALRQLRAAWDAAERTGGSER
jgi:RNA polymerase sigma-70 factor (ECF subfamily)